MKYCLTCETEKEESSFHKRKASVDGLAAKCITCQKVYDKARSGDKAREMQRRIYAQTEEGKLAGSKAKAKYRKLNPNKYKAHTLVNNAIRSGRLFSECCEMCDKEEGCHAHHDDYAKPLNVRWLCAACHSQWHRDNGEALNP